MFPANVPPETGTSVASSSRPLARESPPLTMHCAAPSDTPGLPAQPTTGFVKICTSLYFTVNRARLNRSLRSRRSDLTPASHDLAVLGLNVTFAILPPEM